MRLMIQLLLVLIAFSGGLAAQQPSQFYAYHTKLVHTSTDFFGKYADLIIVLGEGKQLEFTRRTQYAPQWVTASGAFPVDAFFPGRDIDYAFNYNYVRLLEESPDKIVVHWRYMPDIDQIDEANARLEPTFMEGFTNVVHELYTIYPDGKVEREVKDARGSRIEAWEEDDYAHRQTFYLKESGIEYDPVSWGDSQLPERTALAGNPIVETAGLVEPAMEWKLDEGMNSFPGDLGEESGEFVDMVVEWQGEEVHSVLGHGMVFRKGVSGTALAFDGYYTGIEVPEFATSTGDTYYQEREAIGSGEGLSIEAWIALDVYPFNTAPILHQSEGFGAKGFYFGLGPYGHLLLTVEGNTIQSEEPIALYRWTHVAAVVGAETLSLFVDGEEVASGSFSGKMSTPDAPLMIGLNTEKERCTDYVRSPMQNITFIYGIQGLLDEVKVYDESLSGEEITASYSRFVPENLESPLEKAVLPGELGAADQFGAYYKTLDYQEIWDNMWRLTDYTDIVVKFENNPGSVVFWHGTNFAANWVTDNNRWMADQSSEIFTKHGCSEHMADKQTRHSYARVIENNDARVVVHWRYPCVDVGYICTDRRNFSDEYHTIYPDGTGVRKVVFNNTEAPGFQDVQFFTNPGETALDVVHINAMTVANADGKTLELVWEKPNKNPPQALEDATIEWLNSKSDWKVSLIFQGPGISTWGSFEQSEYTDDPFAGPWNHWPISLVPSDGRYAVANDRVTHFALGANDYAPEHDGVVHYGFTNESIEALIPKARYWQNPPAIVDLTGASAKSFVTEEKAYYLNNVKGDLAFTIEASSESPVVNPCFVLENYAFSKPEVEINGTVIEDTRTAQVRNAEGKINTLIWIPYQSDEPVPVKIQQN